MGKKEKVTFCGHEMDHNGLHKTQSKIDAVVNAPKIENVKQLSSFLGLVEYYSKFCRTYQRFSDHYMNY